MPKLDILGKTVGSLEEGILRRKAGSQGTWYLETEEGLLSISDIFQPYKNKEVRVTIVDLREADTLQDTEILSGSGND